LGIPANQCRALAATFVKPVYGLFYTPVNDFAHSDVRKRPETSRLENRLLGRTEQFRARGLVVEHGRETGASLSARV